MHVTNLRIRAGTTEYLHGEEWVWIPSLDKAQELTQKWMIGINVRAETMKHRKKHKNKSCCMWVTQSLLRHNTKHTSDKRKLDKLDFTKIKSFCATNDTIKRVRDNPQNGKNICNHIRDLWYPKYIKNSNKSITKR